MNEQLKEILPSLASEKPIVIREPIRIYGLIAKIKTEL
jgi:hypothetical protein